MTIGKHHLLSIFTSTPLAHKQLLSMNIPVCGVLAGVYPPLKLELLRISKWCNCEALAEAHLMGNDSWIELLKISVLQPPRNTEFDLFRDDHMKKPRKFKDLPPKRRTARKVVTSYDLLLVPNPIFALSYVSTARFAE